VLAGTDLFTVEVLTLRGLVTCYVLLFIHLKRRKVDIAGITVHPNEQSAPPLTFGRTRATNQQLTDRGRSKSKKFGIKRRNL
jgi:hypothetical protein